MAGRPPGRSADRPGDRTTKSLGELAQSLGRPADRPTGPTHPAEDRFRGHLGHPDTADRPVAWPDGIRCFHRPDCPRRAPPPVGSAKIKAAAPQRRQRRLVWPVPKRTGKPLHAHYGCVFKPLHTTFLTTVSHFSVVRNGKKRTGKPLHDHYGCVFKPVHTTCSLCVMETNIPLNHDMTITGALFDGAETSGRPRCGTSDGVL